MRIERALAAGLVMSFIVGFAIHGFHRAASADRPNHSSGVPEVRWILDEADLLRCRAPTQLLRRLSAAYGDRITIRAIVVGEDHDWMASYLRSQRLAGVVEVERTSRRQLEASNSEEGLYLIRRDSILLFVPPGPQYRFDGMQEMAVMLEEVVPNATDTRSVAAVSRNHPHHRRP